jgi:phasin family protein
MAGNGKRDAAFGRMFGDFKVPPVDFGMLMDAQRKNMEALATANRIALEGMQAVARRHTEIVRDAVTELQQFWKQNLSAGPGEVDVGKHTDMMKVQFEKSLANLREITEMIAKSNAEAAEVVTARVSASLSELSSSGKK